MHLLLLELERSVSAPQHRAAHGLTTWMNCITGYNTRGPQTRGGAERSGAPAKMGHKSRWCEAWGEGNTAALYLVAVPPPPPLPIPRHDDALSHATLRQQKETKNNKRC